jgi:hypothetical protein
MSRYYKTSGKGSAAKRTAWSWFSKYIRLRDCLKTTGSPDYCKCITCGRVVSADQIDAGHAIPGRTNGILFDESIVFGQCRDCNRNKGGAELMFKKILIEKHGQNWYDIKLQARRGASFLTDDALRLISDHYRQKYKELLKNY